MIDEAKIKAFDIVRAKRVNVYSEIIAVNSYEEYIEEFTLGIFATLLLTRDEWEFLKEMFKVKEIFVK